MWKLEAGERIARWRDFRKSLDSLTLERALTQTAELWDTVPFTPYYLDSEFPDKWPDPWTLIHENYYCDLAKALGIVYTISLTEHKKDIDVELRVYQDPKTKYDYNLAYFNRGKYILNLIGGEVVNIEQLDQKLKLKKQYNAADLKLDNY